MSSEKERLLNRLKKLDVLQEVSETLVSSQPPEEFCEALVIAISNITGLSACCLIVRTREGKFCRLASIGSNIKRDYFLEVESKLCRLAAKRRKSVREEFAPTEAPASEKQAKFYLAVPLIYKEVVVGILLAVSLHPLNKENERFITTVGYQLAVTLEANRLEQKLALEAAEFLSLIDIGTAISSQLDLKALLDLITHTAVQLVRGETASLMLFNHETGRLEIAAAYGLQEDIVKKMGGKTTHKVADWVIEKGTPLLLDDVSKDPRFKGVARERRRIKSALVVPLITKQKAVGVLSVDNARSDRGFIHDDLDLLTILADQVATAIENARLYTEMRELYLSTIRALVFATEVKDRYTKGHSDRVTEYAVAIAEKLKLPEEVVENIRYAGILHDIGKIGIPEGILLKPSKLTKEERKIVETHPKASVKIIQPIKFLKEVVPIVWHHHERYDGKGYTDELRGEDIPLDARILAVADAYEAMTSNRPYRAAMSKEEAIAELKRCSGAQFDPKLVKVFLSIIGEKTNKKKK